MMLLTEDEQAMRPEALFIPLLSGSILLSTPPCAAVMQNCPRQRVCAHANHRMIGDEELRIHRRGSDNCGVSGKGG